MSKAQHELEAEYGLQGSGVRRNLLGCGVLYGIWSPFSEQNEKGRGRGGKEAGDMG